MKMSVSTTVVFRFRLSFAIQIRTGNSDIRRRPLPSYLSVVPQFLLTLLSSASFVATIVAWAKRSLQGNPKSSLSRTQIKWRSTRKEDRQPPLIEGFLKSVQ
jgi:hypothetical protein